MSKLWRVVASKSVRRQFQKLPEKIRSAMVALVREMNQEGPIRDNWPSFGWLEQEKCYHCHLKNGNPTYVALWSVDKGAITVEVIYVGTHEKAPY